MGKTGHNILPSQLSTRQHPTSTAPHPEAQSFTRRQHHQHVPDAARPELDDVVMNNEGLRTVSTTQPSPSVLPQQGLLLLPEHVAARVLLLLLLSRQAAAPL